MVAGGTTMSVTFNLTAATIAGVSGAGYNDGTAGTIGSAGGTMTPTALLSRHVAELVSTTVPNDRLIVKGFTANPLQTWLISLHYPVTSNAGPALTLFGSAATFSYDSPNGAATWLWSGSGLGMINGITYTGNTITFLPA